MAVIRVPKSIRESGVLVVRQSADQVDDLILNSQVSGHEFIEVNDSNNADQLVRIRRTLIQSYE